MDRQVRFLDPSVSLASFNSQQDDQAGCRVCARRSDWDFLREFYQREEIAKQQVQNLNGHVVQLRAALQHAGQTSQEDRIALNKSHDHMVHLQTGFNESEAARARLENELHEERQENQTCQKLLNHEHARHSETEKNLNSVWTAYTRLRDTMPQINCHVEEGVADSPHESYDITDLVLELSAKSQRISDLEVHSDQIQDHHHTEVAQLKEKLDSESTQHTEEFMGQAQRIHELEVTLQNVNARWNKVKDIPEPRESPKSPKRRVRFRARGKAGKNTEPEEATIPSPALNQRQLRQKTHVSAIKEERL